LGLAISPTPVVLLAISSTIIIPANSRISLPLLKKTCQSKKGKREGRSFNQMAPPLGSGEIFEREYFEHNPVRTKGRGKDRERIKEGESQ
jgi:hypothetical protein